MFGTGAVKTAGIWGHGGQVSMVLGGATRGEER